MPPLRRIRHLGLIIVLAGLALAAGSSSARAQSPGETVAQGAQLYAQNCAVCHGANGQGRVGATLAKDWPSIRPDLRVKETISNGIPGSAMPAWSETNGGPLSEAEIDALAAYILTWQTGGPAVIVTAPPAASRPPITPAAQVEGDPNHGAVLYDQNCAVCHGPNLEGRIGATLAKDWPSIRPDLRVRETIANGIPGSPMPAWLQANGGPLSEAEINDLVAFVLSRPGAPSPEPTATLAFLAPVSPNSPLTGWAGVVLFLALFIGIVSFAIWYQTRNA